ncbi:MAG: hypothetical protein OEY14_13680 [Myxococcales bacterium]|nr:hypothetical protein [Myxococcales bacterium]
MRYLSPPWELDEISGTYARLFIEPNGYRFVGSIAIPAKYDLTLDIEPGFARARAEAELAEMATAGYVERVGPRELITASGDVGWEVLGRDETILFRNHRVIFFESTSGVLRVHLEGYPELDEGEMNRMLSSIEPRVEPEA